MGVQVAEVCCILFAYKIFSINGKYQAQPVADKGAEKEGLAIAENSLQVCPVAKTRAVSGEVGCNHTFKKNPWIFP